MLFTCSPLKYIIAGNEDLVNYKIHKNMTVTSKYISKLCHSTMKYNLLDITKDGKIQSSVLVDRNEMSDKIVRKC